LRAAKIAGQAVLPAEPRLATFGGNGPATRGRLQK
jgi:hypothetical protein